MQVIIVETTLCNLITVVDLESNLSSVCIAWFCLCNWMFRWQQTGCAKLPSCLTRLTNAATPFQQRRSFLPGFSSPFGGKSKKLVYTEQTLLGWVLMACSCYLHKYIYCLCCFSCTSLRPLFMIYRNLSYPLIAWINAGPIFYFPNLRLFLVCIF